MFTKDELTQLRAGLKAWVKEPMETGMQTAMLGYMLLPKGLDEEFMENTQTISKKAAETRLETIKPLLDKLDDLLGTETEEE